SAAAAAPARRPFPGLLLMGGAFFLVSGISAGWNGVIASVLSIAVLVGSMVRNEKFSGLGVLIMFLAIMSGGYSFITAPPAGVSRAQPSVNRDITPSVTTGPTSAVDAVRVVSTRWVKDPDFTRSGAIKWFAEVENTSARNIASARIEFTTYDAAGNIVSKDSGFATAVPAGGRGSVSGYADFYRTEKTATFRVTWANYAN
ncbi:MAG: FxLYD domain-containing protein, partial [Burkholderiales bacterium]|nr:FxLYD domain-containing protein [Burkholderiales bacterium]